MIDKSERNLNRQVCLVSSINRIIEDAMYFLLVKTKVKQIKKSLVKAQINIFLNQLKNNILPM